ncbi:hypothetical protein BDA99DRAFT_558236 [Phascolomyces articulosus]|uniref:Arrestin-like N-terminal domain-containing protein n=1 Tax=Phascolomyces articulosus TaxID=60185 RepID=A0AAD5KDT1_9FUNG|nr:hypothetical protein BDA99DRAFT_558236 [Phascolomyces articulosus]
MSDNTQLKITILDPQPYYRPGQQIHGNVAIQTASGKSLTFAALRLVWTGRIVTQLAGQFDRKEYFNQVFHLDPNTNGFLLASDLSTSPGTLLQVDEYDSFPFQITLPSDRLLPSSFEINDAMMGALSNVEYMIEVALDHQTFDPMPIKARSSVLVMAHPSSIQTSIQQQQESQTSEKTYLSTVLQDRAEYRTAARITVPCKTSPRGAMLNIVAHIWHDCRYHRRNGVSLTLVRMCKIRCGERTEIIPKDIATITRDLDLELRSGYSVQTLQESLQIPYDTVPTITNDQGELASIEYKIVLAVHAHPGALYTELPSTRATTAMQYMLVESPLAIDTNTVHNPQQQQQQQDPPATPVYPDSNKMARGDTARFTSTNTAVPAKDTKKMTDRMKGMFRRRSKLEPTGGVPVLNDQNNESSSSLTNSTNSNNGNGKGSTSLRQVMSSLRPRNNSSHNIAAATNGITKPQSCSSSTHSSQIQSTPLLNNKSSSPPQSETSSITDISTRKQPAKPTTPLPPPPSAVPASLTDDNNNESPTKTSPPPLPPQSVPASSSSASSPVSPVSPPPVYSETKSFSNLAAGGTTTPSTPVSTAPLTPNLTRAKSTHEKSLPIINSVPLPSAQESHDPIPGLEGGGVHYFDMFPDSDDEEEEQPPPSATSVTSPTSQINGGDDQTEITSITTDSNQPRYFNIFPDSDDDDEEVVIATNQPARRQDMRQIYPDAENKLDEVNVSESEPDSDSEDEMDLIAIMAKRERRIERARKRNK